MNGLFRPIRLVARVGFFLISWSLVGLVFVQVFHAGSAVLVNGGDWTAHVNLGHLFALPIMAMIALSIISWMGLRFVLMSAGLFALYVLQYIFLHAMPASGAPALTALHPVNALVIGYTAYQCGREAWRVLTGAWQPGDKTQRGALALAAAVVAVGFASLALNSANLPTEGENRNAAPSLADATEASVPAEYRAAQNPFPRGDARVVTAGQQIAQQRCIVCHAADYKGKQLGAVRSADLTQSAAARSDQFLLWAISRGSHRGMPAWDETLSDEQRWQLVTFIKSLAP